MYSFAGFNVELLVDLYMTLPIFSIIISKKFSQIASIDRHICGDGLGLAPCKLKEPSRIVTPNYIG